MLRTRARQSSEAARYESFLILGLTSLITRYSLVEDALTGGLTKSIGMNCGSYVIAAMGRLCDY